MKLKIFDNQRGGHSVSESTAYFRINKNSSSISKGMAERLKLTKGLEYFLMITEDEDTPEDKRDFYLCIMDTENKLPGALKLTLSMGQFVFSSQGLTKRFKFTAGIYDLLPPTTYEDRQWYKMMLITEIVSKRKETQE